MALWEATGNEVLYQAFNQIGNLEALDSYAASGNFLRDYISYVNILGIFPHPKIVRDLRTLLEDIAKEDEVLSRTRVNSKKKGAGAKKTPPKKPGALEEAPPRGKSRNDPRGEVSEVKVTEVAEIVVDESIPISQLSHVLFSNIEVRGWKIDNGTAHALSLAIQSTSSIKSLRFYNTEMSDEAAKLMVESLTRNTSLTCLALEAHINLSPIFASLPPSTSFSNIQQLSLLSNKIEDDVLINLLPNVLGPTSQLISLDLWDNHITDSGASSLATCLQTNSSLTILSLGKNSIGDSGAVALATILGRYALSAEETASRKKLRADLEFKKKEVERKKKKSGNANALARSTDKMSNLKDDRKNDKNLKEEKVVTPEPQKKKIVKKAEPSLDEQIAALQPVEEIEGLWYVDGNRTLASLNLRLNKITDAGAEALLKIFPVNRVLERFVCEQNLFSDEMKEALSEAMQRREEEGEPEEEEDMYDLDPPYIYSQEPIL
eukprot:Phypoly_transcript_08151.p1 GENE.Phypoly_transcript_08151~~Phypoly_transcript_08151.p1  ORF type:complete len:498 (+),score=116.27 Phypoly_transcript_08151:22-1494(+)